jgi:WD40 repeat protein
MPRIKFFIVLMLVCLSVVGCSAFGASNSDPNLSAQIVPSNVGDVQLLRTLGHGEIKQLAVSPDGSTMAVATSLGVWLYDAAPLFTTRRLEVPTPRLLVGHVGDVTTLAFSPDSAFLASGGEDATIRVWDVETGNSVGAPMQHSAQVSGVAYSPDGLILATSGYDDTVRLWSVDPVRVYNRTFGVPLIPPMIQEYAMTSVAFSPLTDGESFLLMAGGTDSAIRRWRVNRDGTVDDTNAVELRGGAGSALSIAFSPDGHFLASGHQPFDRLNSNVYLWDMQAPEPQIVGVMQGHTNGVQSVNFSPSGAMLTSASSDGTVRLWNVNSRSAMLVLDDHAAFVSGAFFSPDNSIILSGGDDGKIRIWGIGVGGQINQITGFGSDIISIAFSPDGTLIAAGTDDNAVHLWDTTSGEEVATLRGHRDSILSVAFSPDGERLASGSSDHTVLLWNIEASLEAGELSPCNRTSVYGGLNAAQQANHNCNRVHELAGFTNDVRSLSFSDDGSLLATGSCAQQEGRRCSSGEVRLWDVDMPGEISLLLEQSDWVDSVAFSPDGSQLASGSRDQTIAIWDIETGNLTTTLYGQLGEVESVAFSDNGLLLVSGGGDENVLIWDLVNSDNPPRVLSGHTEDITHVTFSPDGRLIVSASRDDHVRVWDVRSGIILGDFVGHIGDVNSVAYRQDGTMFASGGADSTIRLWGLP